jgi:predicted DNA-binding transcriptional regulator YafY
MRTFALTRLRAPEVTQEHFAVPKKFNLNEYLRGSFSVFKGGDDYEVVIDFDSWAADLIRGRRWHSSQELTDLPSRQIRLRMRLNSIEEAERWVLSWGTHATVVRPQALAERLSKTAAELHQRYSGAVKEAENWEHGREQVLPALGLLNGMTKSAASAQRAKKATA